MRLLIVSLFVLVCLPIFAALWAIDMMRLAARALAR